MWSKDYGHHRLASLATGRKSDLDAHQKGRGSALKPRFAPLMIPCSLFCLALAVVTLAVPTVLPAGETKNDPIAFPNGDPAKLGIDMPALEKLKAKAEAEGSDAVLVVKDGRSAADWDFGKKRGPDSRDVGHQVDRQPRRRQAHRTG